MQNGRIIGSTEGNIELMHQVIFVEGKNGHSGKLVEISTNQWKVEADNLDGPASVIALSDRNKIFPTVSDLSHAHAYMGKSGQYIRCEL